MLRFATVVFAGMGLTCIPAFAALTFVTSPGGLAPNDSTVWSQLGGDQTALPGGFAATSANTVGVTGAFSASDDTGLVAVVCAALPTCSWGPETSGMNPGDSDIWAFDNSTGLGTGPLTLTFSTPLIGGGAWIDADTDTGYTASIQAFNGGTSLGSFSVGSGNSDPIFVGVLENPATSNITKIVFSLTACADCSNLGDFAIDTLLMKDTAVAPEPSSVLFFGIGLAGMAWGLRNRSRTNRPRA